MFWKAYATTFGLVVILGLLWPLRAESLPLTILGQVVSVVTAVGLFGFAFRRRILRPWVWRLWFPLLLVWAMLWSLAPGVLGMTDVRPFSVDSPVAVLAALAAIPITLPLYVAHFRYAFRSRQLWMGYPEASG